MAKQKPKRRHKTDPPPLTARQIRFCQIWVERGNKTRSYIEAGFPHKTEDVASKLANRLFRSVPIRLYIRQLQRAAADAAMATTEAIAQGLARTAFADRRTLYDKTGKLLPPHLWPDDIAATVERVETEEVYQSAGRGKKRKLVGYTKKVWTAKRTEAQKVLAQWRGMIGTADDKPTAPAPPLTIEVDAPHADAPAPEGDATGQ